MIFPRNIKENLEKALRRSPVVCLTGPRQSGKTVLMQEVAKERNYMYVTFDNIHMLTVAKNNPIGFINNIKKPVVLDEVQRVPELFLAIKKDVDEHREPGRFALTGSANPLLIPSLGDSLAGRMEIFYLYPFSQGELLHKKETFLDRIFQQRVHEVTPEEITSVAMVKRIFTGGFPPVHAMSDEDRYAWFSGYVTNLIERDVKDLVNVTDLVDFPKLLNLLATRVSGLINFADVSRDCALVTTTLRRYLALLQTLYMIQFNKPWFSNLGLRFVKAPKLYFTDTGLLSYVLDLSREKLTLDSTFGGKLFENFIVSELYKQATWYQGRVGMYHLRDHGGNEVDIILENPQGEIVAIEAKATETVTPRDFKVLKFLQEKMGKRFIAGIVMYQGAEVVPAGDQLFALPASSLWS
jgi:predicted AAA+ superfamily ATPase